MGLSALLGGEDAVVHIDGISLYEVSTDGHLRTHRLENIEVAGQTPQLAHMLAWPLASVPETPMTAVPFTCADRLR